MKLKYILFAICICNAYLSLKNLDNTPFWDDEAHDAIFAENYLKFGKLTAWDGRNLYTYVNGSALDENLRTRNLPLDIIVCAASFKIFHPSTWAGRFPFVLIGFLSLWIFYLIVKTDFGNDDWLTFYLVGGLALSIVFILNIRSCRYYSFSLFTSLLIYYGYRKYLVSKKNNFFLLLTFAAILSFYANPMICAATLISIAVCHLLFYRKTFSSTDWKITTGITTLFLLLTLPYALYYRIWVRPDHTLWTQLSWYKHRLVLICWNLSAINLMDCLPWPILIGLGFFLIKNKNNPVTRMTLQWALLALVHIICIGMMSPQQTFHWSNADIRYLISVVPFLIGLSGIFLWFVTRWSKIIGILSFAVLLTSNVLTLTPNNTEFKWLLPGMLYEVHHDYPTSTGAVVEYLKQNTKQDDFVSCFPDFHNYPVMFYLGDKIKICCTIDNQSPFYHKLPKEITAPVYKDENFPDWIVCFGFERNALDNLNYYKRVFLQNGALYRNQYTLATVMDYYYFDTHRPEIFLHSFGPKKTSSIYEGTFVFKKSETVRISTPISNPMGTIHK